jgi:acetylornithine deacetylase/succinyl-diaminopimelate desuccinylase-like protein
MNKQQTLHFVDQLWDEHIVPTLMDYIKIPNKSPQFDADWQTHGYMDQAVELLSHWCKTQAIKNMTLEIVRLENRTPLIFIDIPGNNEDTILLYGHLDKQPEMTGWEEDLHPWKPVLRGDKLYGRGAADDGYALFASLTAIKSLHEQHIPHARCVILIEACEESGSYDLPYYVDALQDRIGKPSLIICLDSGCGNYEQLWLTTSLRGVAGGILHIDILKQGIHSGVGSGIVPSTFRVLRQLLNRIENEKTGDLLLEDLYVTIPDARQLQAKQAADVLDQSVYSDLPFEPNVLPESMDIPELILRRTWKPALSVTGMDGLPAIHNAGNVTVPSLSVKISLRLAPTCDPEKASHVLKHILEKDPPHQAKIQFKTEAASPGWDAPAEEPWLAASVQRASQTYFGKNAVYMGEGGSIPFMGMLGKKFPEAQFIITGLLGPGSNAHGPNEFLHIPTAKKLTACIAQLIAEHYVKETM